MKHKKQNKGQVTFQGFISNTIDDLLIDMEEYKKEINARFPYGYKDVYSHIGICKSFRSITIENLLIDIEKNKDEITSGIQNSTNFFYGYISVTIK